MQQSKNPADTYYLQRSAYTGLVAAGANAQSSKFITHAALLLWSLSPSLQVAGTSTYTANGTATINAQQLSLISIVNTASAGATAALSTTTIGPFLSGGGFVGGGTGTAQVNSPSNFSLSTAFGPAGQGGVAIPANATLYVVSGTDATASSAFAIDYSVQQFAPVTI